MKRKTVVVMSVTMVIVMCNAHSSHADKVLWDAITSGGVVGSGSGTNLLSSSVGQPAVDMLEGSTHRIYSGFWNLWLMGSVGTGFEIASGLPTQFRLHGNYPNPFRTQTTVHYDIVSTSRVTLEIYDMLGHRVRVLTDVPHEPGFYTVQWDGRDTAHRQVGSGVYFCRMRAQVSGESGYSATSELLFLK